MSLSKHKRQLDSSSSNEGGGGGQRHSKRPAPFKSNLQDHENNGPPVYFSLDGIRQVVREEMEQAILNLKELIDSRIQNAQEGFIPRIDSLLKNAIQEFVCKGLDHANPHSFKPDKRILPESTQITETRNMQLHFNSKLSLPLFTGTPLQGKKGCPLQIELVDANTGRVVTSGPESSAKLDVVVLRGDFNRDDDDTWLATEFEEYMVKARERKGPLLTGTLQVKLKEGTGELGNLEFTDNSSWNSSKMFRIGVKVASGFRGGIRVREAITEAFTVKEHRGKTYEKHDEPASDDEIWRLKKIGKDGPFCKRLKDKGIERVEEFVRHLTGDSKELRNILGSGMPDKKWNALRDHANKCVPDGKSYVYYRDDKKDCGVVISNICRLKGLIVGGAYNTTEQLSDIQKAFADNLVKAASKNWKHVKEFNGESSSTPVLSKSLTACPVEYPRNQQLSGDPSECRLTRLSFPITGSSEVPLGSSVPVPRGLTIGSPSVNHNHMLPDNTNLNNIVPQQYVSPWNQQETFAKENMQCTELEPHGSPSSDSFINSLLNLDTENLFDSSSDPHFGRNFTQGNGRGGIIWLMVKVKFQWGDFVRRRANERIVELD